MSDEADVFTAESCRLMYGRGDEESWRSDAGYFSGPSDYGAITNALGVSVVEVHDSDYQGDSRVLLQNPDDPEQFAIVIYGWGSCSGCDALQACDSWQEVADLANGFARAREWKSREETLKYLREHDWAGDYSRGDETQRFVNESIAALMRTLGLKDAAPAVES